MFLGSKWDWGVHEEEMVIRVYIRMKDLKFPFFWSTVRV